MLRHVFFVIPAALTTIGACGSSSSSSSSNSSPPGATCVTPKDECDLVSVADVSAAAGVTVTASPNTGTMAPGDPSLDIPASGQCQFLSGTNDDNSYTYNYECGLNSIQASSEVMAYKGQVATGTAVLVPGLGDYADWASAAAGNDAGITGGTLNVVSGNGVLSVSVITATGDAQTIATAIAQKAIAALY